MTCTYCNTDHGDMDCDIDDIREYVDQLALMVEDQAAVICHQVQELESSESQTTH